MLSTQNSLSKTTAENEDFKARPLQEDHISDQARRILSSASL